MNEKELINFRSRTDEKLRYAEIHLEELKAKGIYNGDDFSIAHLESFLFQLLGAKDAFLIELYKYYGCPLPTDGISNRKLRDALRKQNKKDSDERSELYSLENNKEGWLSKAKKMRDDSTHLFGINLVHNSSPVCGVPSRNRWRWSHKVTISDPEMNQYYGQDVFNLLTEWLANMKELLDRLRKNAIQNTEADK